MASSPPRPPWNCHQKHKVVWHGAENVGSETDNTLPAELCCVTLGKSARASFFFISVKWG